jgi:hypothetical protein
MTNSTQPGKRRRGRPGGTAHRLRIFPRFGGDELGHKRVDVNRVAIACMMLALIKGYGLSLDEAELRVSEWFRQRGARRVGTTTARHAYAVVFGRNRNPTLRATEAERSRFATLRDLPEDRRRAMVNRLFPLPRREN